MWIQGPCSEVPGTEPRKQLPGQIGWCSGVRATLALTAVVLGSACFPGTGEERNGSDEAALSFRYDRFTDWTVFEVTGQNDSFRFHTELACVRPLVPGCLSSSFGFLQDLIPPGVSIQLEPRPDVLDDSLPGPQSGFAVGSLHLLYDQIRVAARYTGPGCRTEAPACWSVSVGGDRPEEISDWAEIRWDQVSWELWLEPALLGQLAEAEVVEFRSGHLESFIPPTFLDSLQTAVAYVTGQQAVPEALRSQFVGEPRRDLGDSLEGQN